MSKRESGCLSFIFGPCYRQRSKKRNAISVENSEFADKIKDMATQTPEQAFRASAPASFFPSAHKPIIAVRNSNGFHIQELPRDRLIIKNEDVVRPKLNSINSSEDLPSIPNEHNFEPIMSSKSLQRLFSPSNAVQILPNPFKWDKNKDKPRLTPITPEQFFKKKVIPSHRPIRPLERILQESTFKET